MRVLAQTIVLALLLTYPLGVSAQQSPNPAPSPSNGRAVPADYGQYAQPTTGQPNANADNQLPQAPPLPPPKTQNVAGHPDPTKTPGGIQSLTTVVVSLVVVLAIFFVVVWMLRRALPGGAGTLPAEAFETLGRAALANRQQVHLLRCGNKLLLVSVTATGAETLTEITDPAEVDRLSDLCRQARTNVAATALRRVFRPAEARDA